MKEKAPLRSAVTLRPWREREAEVLALRLAEHQYRFVSGQTVAEFLAAADAYPTFASYAVCAGDAVVGMACLGRDPEQPVSAMWIPLLVIGIGDQGQGHGRAALEAIIARARAAPGTGELGLDCHVENEVAFRLYHSLGFRGEKLNAKGERELWLTTDES